MNSNNLTRLILAIVIFPAATSSCSLKLNQVSLIPSPITLTPGESSPTTGSTLQFEATGGVPPFNFSIASGPGTITSTGLYTRPWNSGTSLIRVTDNAGATATATATLSATSYQVGGGAGTAVYYYGGATDADGNFYAVGYTTAGSGQVGTQVGTHGTWDYIVAKYSATGALAWTKQIGGGAATTSFANAVAVDNQGNIIVVGYTNSTIIGTQLGVHGNYDILVTKLDSTGTQLWAKQWGAAGVNTIGLATAVDSDRNIYAYGYGSGASGDYGTQQGIHSTTDVVAFKFNSAGGVVWSTQIGGGAGAANNGAGGVVDSLGNSYISGYTNAASGGFGTQSGTHGTRDYFVMKLDNSGTIAWSKQVGGGAATDSRAWAIRRHSNGELFIGGYTSGTLGTQIGTHGTIDAFLAKLDSTGGVTWTRQIGAVGTTTFYNNNAFAIDSSGNSYIGGYTDAGSGVLGTQVGVHSTNDYFVRQFDSSGNSGFALQVGMGAGAYATSPRSFAVNSQDELFITGYTTSPAGTVGTQVGTHGTHSGVVVKMNSAGEFQ